MSKNRNPIPDEVWDQHVGILAKTGRGKTVTAKGGAARVMSKGIRVGVVDPTGAWWGMRLKADGKTQAFPMVIFGGDHGDVAIDKRMGVKIGALVASSNWSWIVDISKMGVEDRTLFMTDFAEALFAENKRRLNLFLDECHLYMPQQKLPTRASSHMTAACNNLVSGGRSRGFCITMISQRSAKVHKDSLTQAETLITLGMIAPQDIAAAEAWVKVQGDLKAASTMLKSLPALPVGEGWVYAPELGMLDRVKFPMIETFDSSRAPGVGEELAAPTELGQINLEEIRALLAPAGRKIVVEPKTSPSGKARPAPDRVEINAAAFTVSSQRAHQRALGEARADGFREGVAATIAAVRPLLDGMTTDFGAILATAGQRTGIEVERGLRQLRLGILKAGSLKPPKGSPAPLSAAVAKPSPRAEATGSPKQASRVKSIPQNGLSGAQRDVLAGLAWWVAMGHEMVTKAQLAGKIGWKVTGSHLRNRLGELASAGLVTYPGHGKVSLTPEGHYAAPEPDVSQTLLASIRAQLTTAQLTVFDALSHHPQTRQEIADAIGWEAGGSHLRNRLGELSALELVTYPSRGEVMLQEWVK